MLSGAILLVIALTGCIYAFQDEIQDLTLSWRKIPMEDKPFVNPSNIFEQLTKEFPESTGSMIVYQNGERPANVTIEIDSVPHNVYFNPYSGEITHVKIWIPISS
jgi:uncharacterized iron-regulated membrane protein